MFSGMFGSAAEARSSPPGTKGLHASDVCAHCSVARAAPRHRPGTDEHPVDSSRAPPHQRERTRQRQRDALLECGMIVRLDEHVHACLGRCARERVAAKAVTTENAESDRPSLAWSCRVTVCASLTVGGSADSGRC